MPPAPVLTLDKLISVVEVGYFHIFPVPQQGHIPSRIVETFSTGFGLADVEAADSQISHQYGFRKRTRNREGRTDLRRFLTAGPRFRGRYPLRIVPILAAFHSMIPEGVRLHLSDPATLLFLGLITMITVLLAGFYPAKVLSSYLPALARIGRAHV